MIIRGLRIRVGDSATGEDPSERRATWTATGSYNVIYDHCSFYWTIDTQHLVQYDTYNVTFQYCIIAEPLNNSIHAKGSATIPGASAHGDSFNADSSDGVTLAHCLIWSGNARNPQLATNTQMKMVGCIIGNYGNSAVEVQERSKLDAMGNIFIRGTNSPDTNDVKEFQMAGSATDRLFLWRNIGRSHPTELAANEWLMVDGSEATYRNTALNRAEPTRPASQYTTTGDVALNWVLDNVGAIHPSRDAIDAAVIAEVRAQTGSIKDCVEQGVTIYWPSGTATSGSAPRTVTIPASPGGVTGNRYTGKTIELDISPLDGTYETSRTILTNTVPLGGDIEIVVTADWTTTPSATSLYRILNPCTSNYTTGYGTYSAGSAPTDTDADLLSDVAELWLTGGASTTSATVTGDLDSDGYENVEDWINDYYYPHLSPYLTKGN